MDCEESNINDVFISSLIYRARKRLNDKVIAVNNILKRVCKLNGLLFIDNSNICLENSIEDGLHLNHDGKVILVNNFIYVLNFKSYEIANFMMALVRMVFYSKQIFMTTMMSIPISQIVLKWKKHIPVFAIMWLETRI